tara:strand:+ start:608 stop:1009 length:402 start_codon:yes stop_codon:yes gene_type:complete
MNWLINMYRSLYLLSVPEDKTVIRSGFSGLLDRGKDSLPPQQHPRGDNDYTDLEPYQLDPNDDDMSRLQETAATYEYREEREERKSSSGVNLDRIQNYYAERDRDMEMEREREMDREWELYYEGGFHDFNYGP